MTYSIKKYTNRIFFFCVSSIITFLWLTTPVQAYTDLTCKQRITGEHPKYQNITKTFTNAKLCTYITGYTGNLSSISADPEQGVVIPTKPEKVKDVYLYFSGKGGGSPEDNCVGSSDLCKKAEEQGNIAIVFFNRQEGKNRLLNTKESMTFFVEEAKKVLNDLGVSATTYHLMGHSAGGEQVGFAAQFLSHMNFGYSIVFDGCYGEWCDNLIKYPNRGFSILYLNGTELTTTKTVIEAKPTNIQIYDVPGITHELVPETCFNDHITQDGCGVSLKSVYADGSFTGGNNSQASSKTIGTIQDELSELLESPTPRITIPGLSFSPDSVVEQSVQEDGGNFYVSIPYIGEYLSALYRFGVATIVIIATIVLIYAGALWVISGGNGSQIEQAKEYIQKAIIGLVIAIGSYTILSLINPNLTKISSLKILYISEQGIKEAQDEEFFYGKENKLTLTGEELTLPTDEQYCFPMTKESLNKISWNWGDARESGARCHAGIDIYTKAPGNIVAVADGVVTLSSSGFLDCEDGWGMTTNRGTKPGKAHILLIYHEDLGITINYGEIDSDKTTLKTGDSVTKGQHLGVASYCGMLHFELYDGEQYKNKKWLPNTTVNGPNGCALNDLNKKDPAILNPHGVINQLKQSFCK